MTYLWQTHLGDDVAFDTQYHENKRPEIASLFSESPGVVLDIGCGGGMTGRLIKEKFPDARVIGIELNPRAAEHARQWLDTVICEDIDTLDLSAHIGTTRIDTVMFLDVLEHIYDPWRVLVRVRGWLDEHARVIASVPNIRNIANLDDLAGGHWNYGPNGVLDITHVRFFTRESLQKLFEETGYTITQMIPLTQPRFIENHVVDRRPGQLITQNVTIRYRNLNELEELYALQFVIDAKPAAASPQASVRL